MTIYRTMELKLHKEIVKADLAAIRDKRVKKARKILCKIEEELKRGN